MAIISISGMKGGISKTGSAVCLATLLSQNSSVLLVDCDRNRSSILWAAEGKLPFTVCSDREAAKIQRSQNFDHLIFDTGANPDPAEIEALARGCDLLILPTSPDSMSIASLVSFSRMLPSATNWRVLLTMIPPAPQRDGAEARAALTAQGFPLFDRGIRYYKAYKDAATQGLPLYKVRGGKIAWRDWVELRAEVERAIG